jgi:hypothetical protein
VAARIRPGGPPSDSFWTKRGAYEIAGKRGVDAGATPLQTWVPPAMPTKPAIERPRVTSDDRVHVKQPGKGRKEEKYTLNPRTVPITVRGGTKPDR